jgi:hypothetical protein
MEPLNHIDPGHFVHVRMVLSMAVSLAMARLLAGLARFVQHPGRIRTFSVQLLWVAFMLVLLIHFWWWQFALAHLQVWTFATFAFLVGYAALLYLLCAILFPDDIAEYDGYRDYFMSRRTWFFGLLLLVCAIDLVDTRIKGEAYWHAHATAAGLHAAVMAALCMTAILDGRIRVQQVLAVAALLIQGWLIAYRYAVLG